MLGLGALTLAGCGAPAELDESRFPGLNETGYTDLLSPVGNAGSGTLSPPSNAGTGGTGTNVGGVGNGGTAPVAAGGNGSVSTGGNPPVGQGGSDQGGSASEGGSDQQGNDLCPDDITELFARPGTQGGCDGGGCHVPGGISPDLVSPGIVERLLDVPSRCMSIPYIAADDSFLEDKLTGNPPRCNGFAMPLGGTMSEPDKQCVIQWIAEVTGG